VLAIGLLALPLLVMGHLVAHIFGRRAAARALRMPARGFGFAVIDEAAWSGAARGKRALVRGAGAAASYLWPSLLITIAVLGAGRNTSDEASLRVAVSPLGPAAASGMKSGDRVLEVDGAKVADWDDLKRKISAHKGQIVDVKAERDGETVLLSPHVNDQGKILIGPEWKHVSVGLGEALAIGLTEPARVVWATAVAVVRMVVGSERAEMSGPVGVAQEVVKSGGFFEGLRIVGVVAAYILPLMVFVAFAPAARIQRRRPQAP
jgi:regulator of sigma E protease